MLDTKGVNLFSVRTHEDVDALTTVGNHLIEVIEHLAILYDTVTYRGHLMAITRHGINRNDTGSIIRCSFKETIDILLDVAVYAKTDYLRGVTENIMLGQLAPIRTGDCALLLNEEMLRQAINDQLPSYIDGLDIGMKPGRSLMTPFHDDFSPTSSPGYSLSSPGYNPSSPGYSPTSPGYSLTSLPGYSPTSPGYNPTSPTYSPSSPG
ncbi:DNA-directed RNA polymerase II subunit 1, partial [Tanacetum coccineum]